MDDNNIPHLPAEATYPVTSQDLERLDDLYEYHAPKPDQIPRYTCITQCAKILAYAIMRCCPPSPERTLALREVEMARMRANQSIAVHEAD